MPDEDAKIKKLPIRDMDAVDRARFDRVKCEKRTAIAFRALFGDPENENAKLVLEHLTDFCGYGISIKPEYEVKFRNRQDVLMEIKTMLNAAVLFEEEPKKEEENETQD